MRRQLLINRVGKLWPKSGPLSTTLGKRVLLGIVVVVLAAIPLSVRVVPLGLEVGEPAPRDYRAPRSIQYTDEQATSALRKTAADAVAPVYEFDEQAQTTTRRDIVEFFSSVSSLRGTASQDATAQVAFLEERYESRVDTPTIAAVVALPDPSVDTVARTVEGLVASILSARIGEANLGEARNQLARSAELIPLQLAERYAVISVGTAFLQPNVTVDEAATERARADARDHVTPVVVFIQQGENIVERGDIVTERDIEIVRSLGGLEQGTDTRSVVAGIALSALPEVLRFSADFRMIIYGVILVVAMFVMPSGVSGWLRERRLTRLREQLR
jgi:membrane-associated HD superfamily phosphohydrolase